MKLNYSTYQQFVNQYKRRKEVYVNKKRQGYSHDKYLLSIF